MAPKRCGAKEPKKHSSMLASCSPAPSSDAGYEMCRSSQLILQRYPPLSCSRKRDIFPSTPEEIFSPNLKFQRRVGMQPSPNSSLFSAVSLHLCNLPPLCLLCFFSCIGSWRISYNTFWLWSLPSFSFSQIVPCFSIQPINGQQCPYKTHRLINKKSRNRNGLPFRGLLASEVPQAPPPPRKQYRALYLIVRAFCERHHPHDL